VIRPLARPLLALALFAASATAGEPADEPWSVDDPIGPTHTIAFDVDGGTWLHLDVHPDGKRIVVSLLGDLYLLPIEGGDAKRITSGPAYDVQPRFSPDGTQIAFASDRSGMENLWACALDGSGARPLTQEKDGTVSAPAWSPNGDWVVGRKRITDASPLATVELWMWHVKGGQGVRLTKREQQPDAADPTFAPDDDRFVYFSGRSARFEYDRNVNEGIWQLLRLDRRDGKALPITGEFGGAAAPTFSRDGKTLAFVRRVRAKTRIELMDVASGRTRLLADDVQRDNQEGFAFHGVFPGFAFTPDGKAVIASADTHLWRFDAATGARTPIPFHAHVEQLATEPLRQPRHPVADDVPARVLRWATLSPDGRTLAFEAFGHVWTMPASGGAPRRLGSGDDVEVSPAFSPDGRELAYATWYDRDGGHVWRRSISGGKPVRVTDVPGQYANPSFSPDGKRLVFVRGSGATFRAEDLGGELWLEVRWAERNGGPSHLVASVANRGVMRLMPRPAFSPDGARVYFVDDEPVEQPATPPKTVLYSTALDGGDKRAHLRFVRAEEVALSPDARFVAFNEQHDAWIAAIPSESAEAVEAGLENGALPVARLSDEGGEWVAWARGGEAVSFTHGTDVRVVRLADALKTPEPPQPKPAGDDAKAKPALPPAETIAVDLRLPRARPSGIVAYTGARIVTMRGDEVIERGALVVDRDRIAAVGAESDVAIPAGARRVDLAGRTIIPGLFDEHAHLHYATLDVHPQQPWKYLANLAYGVTSTHDVSATSHEVFAQSERVEAGLVVGPRIFSTGTVLYGADIPERTLVHSLDDARKALRRMKSFGAFSVKSYMQPGRDQRRWILQAAREEGMLVVPEGGGDLEMDLTMILDGHTTLEHALPITPLGPDVIQLFARSGVAYTPTLLVAYGGLEGDRWFHQHNELWNDERLARFVPQGIRDVLGRIRSVMVSDPADWHHLDVAAGAREVLRSGGLVNLGGHGQMQGLGPHWEMWAFVQAGMTPLEALRVATLNPAKTLGMDGDLGSLEPGKLADFAVLAKNPLERIENSDSVESVVKNGVAYSVDELAALARTSQMGGSALGAHAAPELD
jgi:Tol biopolymer transport system component/imidazolonepropionase-like amidohydrolase